MSKQHDKLWVECLQGGGYIVREAHRNDVMYQVEIVAFSELDSLLGWLRGNLTDRPSAESAGRLAQGSLGPIQYNEYLRSTQK